MGISRRAVLSLSAASALVPFGDPVVWAAPLHCVVVENGTPGRAGYTVSMLACRDLDDETLALERLRAAQHYHRRNFSYRSTDRRKIPYFHAAMDRFVRSPDVMAYSARVEHGDRRAIRFDAYRRLFTLLPSGAQPVVHLAPRTSDRHEVRLTAHLQQVLGPHARIVVAAPGAVMDFAAVLFGSIRSAQDNGGAPVSSAKQQIVQLAQQALGTPDLKTVSLARTGKFRMG